MGTTVDSDVAPRVFSSAVLAPFGTCPFPPCLVTLCSAVSVITPLMVRRSSSSSSGFPPQPDSASSEEPDSASTNAPLSRASSAVSVVHFADGCGVVGELRERKKPGRGGNPRESFEYRESVLVPPSPWQAFGVVTPLLGEAFGS